MCDIDNPAAEHLMERLSADHGITLPRVRRYCESSILKLLDQGAPVETIYETMTERIKGLPST
jgi:hypothetical protein